MLELSAVMEDMMQKWENLDFAVVLFEQLLVTTIQNRVLKPEERINYHIYVESLGKDGWELVAVEGNHYYFKRPLSDKQLPPT